MEWFPQPDLAVGSKDESARNRQKIGRAQSIARAPILPQHIGVQPCYDRKGAHPISIRLHRPLRKSNRSSSSASTTNRLATNRVFINSENPDSQV